VKFLQGAVIQSLRRCYSYSVAKGSEQLTISGAWVIAETIGSEVAQRSRSVRSEAFAGLAESW
jgi:hypothetical protein